MMVSCGLLVTSVADKVHIARLAFAYKGPRLSENDVQFLRRRTVPRARGTNWGAGPGRVQRRFMRPLCVVRLELLSS